MDHPVSENIDRLVTLEMRPPGILDGVIVPLYNQARSTIGEPLTWYAARRLAESVLAGTTVYILTGHVVPVVMPDGETDGPLGAAALARALTLGLGARVVLLCDEPVVQILGETCKAIGLNVRNQAESTSPSTVAVQSFPSDTASARNAASTFMMQDDVSAIISVEKIGRNRTGVYHTGMGNDTSANLAKLDLLVDQAGQRDILTVGIGDLGNEIGFGLIEDSVRESVPFADECQCPCGQGTACSVATESLVIGGCSNWGAYGIEAALAVQLGDLDLMHTGEMEREMIFQCTRAGGVDGLSAAPSYEVDGVGWETHARWVDLLRETIRINSLKRRALRWGFEVPAQRS